MLVVPVLYDISVPDALKRVLKRVQTGRLNKLYSQCVVFKPACSVRLF